MMDVIMMSVYAECHFC